MIHKCYLTLILATLLLPIKANQTKHISLTKVTPDGGVAISSVMCIEEDSHGFIWFGSNNGLFKYDSREIKKYSYSQYKKNTPPTNRINQIYNDNERLIVVTESGLSQYRPDYDDFVDFKIVDLKGGVINGDFSFLTQTKDSTYWILDKNGLLSFNTNFVTNGYVNVDHVQSQPRLLHLDKQGNLWIVFQNGKIYFKTPGSSDFKLFTTGISRFPRAFFADQKHVWIGYSQHGVYCYDINGNLLKIFNESNGFISNSVRDIIESEQGEIWIATYNGIAIFNDLNLTDVINTNNNPQLAHHSIWSLYKDSKETIWIGTWLGGLSFYSKYQNAVNKQNHSIKNYDIDDDIITSFVQDFDKKQLWISTASGLLKNYNLKDNTESTEQVHYLNDDIHTIKSLALDKNETLWIGTYEQGIFFRRKNEKQFHRLNTHFGLGLQIIDILPVANGIWFSNYQQGVFFLSNKDNSIKRYRHNPLDSTTISNNSVRQMIEDKNGNIWFATEGGLNLMKKDSNNFSRIKYSKKHDAPLSYDFIYTILEDSKGNIWIGSNGGALIKVDIKNNKFTYITTSDGLPADDIYNIIEDTDSNLWLATGNGICEYHTNEQSISTFNNIEDLSENTFNANSGILAADGRLFFGSSNGFISFRPEDVCIKNTRMPVTTIISFSINNKEIIPSEDNPILKKHISSTKHLTLKHKHSLFSFKFVADNFINPKENKFKFRLHNFNEEWIETDNNGLAIFTNIPSGKYVFEVCASNNDGVWNQNPTKIEIEITPPIWKRWYAFSFYVLAIILILYYILREASKQRELEEEIRLEKVKSESDEHIHQMKLQFFTNISHEFRTPLTLIMGPIERLISKFNDDDPISHQLHIIKNNSERLLRLINQILDFRKINAGKLKLKPINIDIIAFSKNIFSCFSEHAKHRDFEYLFESDQPILMADFDPEKLDKIIFNLLSNAFKYCDDKGKIHVQINGDVKDFTLPKTSHEYTLGNSNADKYVEIIISDTGHGITLDNLEHIFERFQQVNESKVQSSGIGLNLTKDYITLHKGKLRVISEIDKGSSFCILLPFKQTHIFTEEIDEEFSPTKLLKTNATISKKDLSNENNKDNKDQAHILIVEDNLELLDYLKSSLSEYFKISKAKNGIEGIQKTNSLHPDLIISDVMMPEMDGIEFCTKIKKDIQTSHIPIILLTALESISDRITGLESGADAYISKPFSINLLLAQISNLLNAREKLKNAFKNQSDIWENHLDKMDLDKQLILKAISYIENNLTNSDISVDELAQKLNLSRTTLHRKLKQLTNQSATEFIRGIRLKNAAKYILDSNFKINEIAFKVGFNSLNYFTRSFKNYYGMSPREYMKHNKL